MSRCTLFILVCVVVTVSADLVAAATGTISLNTGERPAPTFGFPIVATLTDSDGVDVAAPWESPGASRDRRTG